ncbi:putative nicotinate-nucleotide pyrophosphorylase [Trichinella pseudospiralis]
MEPPSSAKEVREQTSQDAVKKVLQLTRQGWTVDTSKPEPELRPLFVRRVEHYRGRRLSALGNTVDHFVEVKEPHFAVTASMPRLTRLIRQGFRYNHGLCLERPDRGCVLAFMD